MNYEVYYDMEKTTEELYNELQKADDVFEFAKENEMELESFCLTELLEEYGLTYENIIVRVYREVSETQEGCYKRCRIGHYIWLSDF